MCGCFVFVRACACKNRSVGINMFVGACACKNRSVGLNISIHRMHICISQPVNGWSGEGLEETSIHRIGIFRFQSI